MSLLCDRIVAKGGLSWVLLGMHFRALRKALARSQG